MFKRKSAVEQHVANLGSYYTEKKYEALHHLDRLASDNNTKVEIASIPGVLEKIVSFLQDKGRMQITAASLLSSLAYHNAENQVKIAGIPGALGKIVLLLQDENGGVRRSAADLLSRLAEDNAENRVKIARVPGALEMLASCFRDWDFGEYVPLASKLSYFDSFTKALTALAANNEENQVEIASTRSVIKGLVLFLQGHYHDNNLPLYESAMRLLRTLAANNEENQVKIASMHGVLETLISLLQHDWPSKRYEAARLLYTLADSAENKVKIVEDFGFLWILDGLLAHEDERLRESAASVLGNLAANNAKNQVVIGSSSSRLERLVSLLQDKNESVQKAAAGALENLAANADNKINIERIKAGLPWLEKPSARVSAEIAAAPMAAGGSVSSSEESDRMRRLEAELEAQRRQIEAMMRLQGAVPAPATPVTTPVSAAAAGAFSLIPYRDLEIGRELGRGGFGVVHEARWRSVAVAVKLLLMSDLPDSLANAFKNEALLHAGLHHDNVVALKGVCLEPRKYALVMELLSRGSLFELLHNGQALPWSQRLSIAQDIARGLAYLHEHGMIHQDLKSLNILLDDRMRAKLADFGLSDIKATTTITTGASTTAKAGAAGVAGSVLWMAPELFKRKAKPTVLSDIYALGVVLWELASRELPFKDARDSALIIKWVTEGDREDIPAGTPPQISSLITRCWDGDPSKRPGSAQTVLRELVTGGIGSAEASSGKAPPDSGYMR